jgi:hypothetical protein
MERLAKASLSPVSKPHHINYILYFVYLNSFMLSTFLYSSMGLQMLMSKGEWLLFIATGAIF